MRTSPLRVLLTAITYLGRRGGFSYMLAVIDCETDLVVDHEVSSTFEDRLVPDTCDKLEGLDLPDGV